MRIAALSLLLLCPGVSFAQSFPRTFDAKVISVTDGDTARVREDDGTVHRIRFNSIDAPESNQPFGDKATEFLEAKVLNETVTVKAEGADQYGRLIAVLGESRARLVVLPLL